MVKKEKNKIIIEGKDLISELGLEGLSPKKQAELIDRMSDIVFKRVLLRVTERLSEGDVGVMNKFLSKKNYKKAEEIIRDKVPEFFSILKEEIEKFGKEIKGRLT